MGALPADAERLRIADRRFEVTARVPLGRKDVPEHEGHVPQDDRQRRNDFAARDLRVVVRQERVKERGRGVVPGGLVHGDGIENGSQAASRWNSP